ncbi:VOC family protein [Streptomyces sp. NPDC050263]|uniref:VOC family protein n=1 Tax=Streptomyces sp. NPDC050263 TaxID=3155037 RepID=UPI0034417AE8
MDVKSETGIGTLTGRLGASLFQQAWVVSDLKVGEEAMRTALGCGEFTEFRMEQKWTLRGETVPGGLALGYARSGNMQIELMQPLAGTSIQHEFFAEHGAGPHHFGYLVADLHASLAAARRDGFDVAMSGRFGSVRVAFLDTYAELGLYLELIEDPDDLYWATRAWRDARDQVHVA